MDYFYANEEKRKILMRQWISFWPRNGKSPSSRLVNYSVNKESEAGEETIQMYIVNLPRIRLVIRLVFVCLLFIH